MAESKPAEKKFNRWIIVIGAILVQFGLGILYSFGIISPALVTQFTNNVKWSFAVALAFFAIAMIPAGKLHDKYGPKIMSVIGGVVLGTSYLLCSILASEAYIIVMYGIMGGIGIGLAYVCPIACAGKWFPDKKGLITGLAVAGFGLGSFAFNFIMEATLVNLGNMFIICGIIIYALVIGGGLILKNPPKGYKPEGWTPPVPAAGAVKKVDWEPKEMIKTKAFWLWWVSYMMSAMIGLLIIGSFKIYIKSGSLVTLIAAQVAAIGSIAAIFNAAGRIGWGKIGDKIGRYKALMVMNIILSIVMFSITPIKDNYAMAIIWVGLVYFCFGGVLAIYPAITMDNFGTKNYGINYGIMFSAYGVAGIMQAVFTILIFGSFTDWLPLFIVLGIMAIGSAVLLLTTKPPVPKNIAETPVPAVK